MNRIDKYNIITKTPKRLWAMASELITALETFDTEDMAWYVANGYNASDIQAMQTALATFQPGLTALEEDDAMRRILGIPEQVNEIGG